MFYSWFQGSQDFTHCAATSDIVAFFFPQDQGQRKNGNKSITFAVKKEGRERKGFKIGHRWENMSILADKAKQKGTEPRNGFEIGLKLESQDSPSAHQGLGRDAVESVQAGKLKSVPSTVCRVPFPMGWGV